MSWSRYLLVFLIASVGSVISTRLITKTVAFPPVGDPRNLSDYTSVYEKYFQDIPYNTEDPPYQQRVRVLVTWAYSTAMLMKNDTVSAYEAWNTLLPLWQQETLPWRIQPYEGLAENWNEQLAYSYCTSVVHDAQLYAYDIHQDYTELFRDLSERYSASQRSINNSMLGETRCADRRNNFIDERKTTVSRTLEELNPQLSRADTSIEELCSIQGDSFLKTMNNESITSGYYASHAAQVYQRKQELIQWRSSNIVAYVSYRCQQDSNQQLFTGSESVQSGVEDISTTSPYQDSQESMEQIYQDFNDLHSSEGSATTDQQEEQEEEAVLLEPGER